MKQFGIIGYPLAHSFSKKYFTEKFGKEGLADHVYDMFPIASIDELPGVLRSNPQLVGLNVTIPYKIQVLSYLHASRIPEKIRACNCIRIQDGRLTGFNTDVIGFEESFRPKLKSHHRRALVLGNGGATAAVVFVLDKLGIEYRIVSRALHDHSSLTYDMLDESLMKEHTVIINTTPLGTFPDTETCPPIPYEHLGGSHYLFDLVYNPGKTMFLKKGAERGAEIQNGYDMLVIQAEESWKIWNGLTT